MQLVPLRNGKLFRIKYLGNAEQKDATCTRIGIVVPKKQVKRAVDRNLVKRRVRDVYRKNKEAWPKDTDLIMYCGSATFEATYDELNAEMLFWGNEFAPKAGLCTLNQVDT
jgi:ribonuclease P protein component